MLSFNANSRRYTQKIALSRKDLNSASEVANWIIVDIPRIIVFSSIFIDLMLSLAD